MADLDLKGRLDQASSKKPEEGEARMTFGEHIEELRSRLLKSLVLLLGVILVAMIYYDELVIFITQPHIEAMGLLGVKDPTLMPGSFGGPLIAIMKLAFIISLFVSSPWIGYQMWAFVGAGLYKNERKYVQRFAPASFVLFTAGCVFGYLKLVPLCLFGLAKSMSFGGSIISNQYLFTDYLSLVMTLTIILGVVFQIPLVMLFLSKVGLVAPSKWNQWRRPAIIANVVFAAVITPADIFTMIIVMIPMLLLYEIGVVSSFLLAPEKKQKT